MSGTVLIVDDYDDNRELLRLLLTSAGYEVREARDGPECLAMVRESLPELIMLDLCMPVIDGWSLLQELKSDQRTATIPCVAVTAYADSDATQALNAGFSGYLSKPFQTAELIETVSRLLSISRTEQGKKVPDSALGVPAPGSQPA